MIRGLIRRIVGRLGSNGTGDPVGLQDNAQLKRLGDRLETAEQDAEARVAKRKARRRESRQVVDRAADSTPSPVPPPDPPTRDMEAFHDAIERQGEVSQETLEGPRLL